MDKYIKSLIERETRVIIPSFGAFLVLREEGMKIVFYAHINFDDGMLAEYIVSQKGCTIEEAKSEVSQYAKSLSERLDNGETVTLDGVGTLSKNNGSIEFVQSDSAQSESYTESGYTSSIYLEESDDASESSSEETPTEESEPEVKEPERVPEEPTTTTESEPVKESTEEPAPATTTYVYQEENNKKKTLLIVALIVLLFLIGAVVLLFFVNKDNALYRAFFAPEEEVVEIVEEPAPIVEEPAPVVEEPAPAEESVVAANPLEKRYNIVVGSYKVKSPAEKRVASLVEKGFENAFVGQRGDWYVAVIESHSSLVEAERRQEEIVDKYRIESWITNAGE